MGRRSKGLPKIETQREEKITRKGQKETKEKRKEETRRRKSKTVYNYI